MVNSIRSRAFELQLAEKYLLNMKNNRMQNLKDFEYLVYYDLEQINFIKSLIDDKLPEKKIIKIINNRSEFSLRKDTGKFPS